MAGVQPLDELGRVGAEMHHRDLGQLLAHQLALGRVVVGEDEAVDAEVQVLRDAPQPARLVVPRAFEGGEIRALAARCAGW